MNGARCPEIEHHCQTPEGRHAVDAIGRPALMRWGGPHSVTLFGLDIGGALAAAPARLDREFLIPLLEAAEIGLLEGRAATIKDPP